MGCVNGTFRLNDGNALIDLPIGKVKTKLVAKYVVEVVIVREPTFVGTTFRITYGDAGVVHGYPPSIGSRFRNDDVARIRRVGMRPRIPVRDFVFGVVPGMRNHSIDVLPAVLQ